MKTPRELLLSRHLKAERKLDAVRESVVGELRHRETKVKSQAEGFVSLLLHWAAAPWRELVLPNRRIWTGLATVWVVLIFVNLLQRDNVASRNAPHAHAPAVMVSWQVQQRWINELLADRVPLPDTGRARNTAPRPRTENSGVATA